MILFSGWQLKTINLTGAKDHKMNNPEKVARKPVTLTISEELIYQAKVRSLQEGILLRDTVEQAIKDFLSKPRI
jgi:hypothetical protein